LSLAGIAVKYLQSMKKIIVIQHESYEALGTLGSVLKREGIRIRYVNFERHPDLRPSLDKYDGLILLGGYMGVYEADTYHHLKVEMNLIEDALKREIPVLGICLGSQILAHVLGAHVGKHHEPEMGWYDVQLTDAGKLDPVIGGFQPTEKVFQAHGDAFEIPKTAIHLASSALCEGQAFRYGANVYGFQFHLEINQRIIDDWLEMPENRKLFRESGEKLDPRKT
jgi:GMP synthase (glutamine-hydrolysing)